MTTTKNTTESSDFYVPATALASDAPGRIEQFLTGLYRVHRFRGGVNLRTAE